MAPFKRESRNRDGLIGTSKVLLGALYCVFSIGSWGCAQRENSVACNRQCEQENCGNISWPSLPDYNDLISCDRIELIYRPTTFSYFLPSKFAQALVNEDEKRIIEAIGIGEITDPIRINQFVEAYDTMDAYGSGTGYVPLERYVDVKCYRDTECLLSFRYLRGGNFFVDATDSRYVYELPLEEIRAFDRIPVLWPFEARVDCAQTIARLGNSLRGLGNSVPNATWCDAIDKPFRRMDFEDWTYLAPRFRCHGSRECHYAKNPDCDANSAPNTVLLFESKPGWNQVGGAELFTFDKHDPRGGCVLLKDGEVRFIRTQAELKQLRWK